MTRLALRLPHLRLVIWHSPSGWPASVTVQLHPQRTVAPPSVAEDRT